MGYFIGTNVWHVVSCGESKQASKQASEFWFGLAKGIYWTCAIQGKGSKLGHITPAGRGCGCSNSICQALPRNHTYQSSLLGSYKMCESKKLVWTFFTPLYSFHSHLSCYKQMHSSKRNALFHGQLAQRPSHRAPWPRLTPELLVALAPVENQAANDHNLSSV